MSKEFFVLCGLQDVLNFGGTALQALLNAILLGQCIQTARLPADRKAELKLQEPSSPSKASPAPT